MEPKEHRQPFLCQFIRLIEVYCCGKAALNITPNNSWTAKIKRLNGRAEALTLVDFVDRRWFEDANIMV
ncbi:MAG: hypothetical protein ACUVQY_08690 [Thermoproteota archaeon]